MNGLSELRVLSLDSNLCNFERKMRQGRSALQRPAEPRRERRCEVL